MAEVAAEADTLARERRARARKELGLEAEEALIPKSLVSSTNVD